MTDADKIEQLERRCASLAAQVSVLDAQRWAARTDAAQAQRHRGQLTGLMLDLLARNALADDDAAAVRRLVELQADEGAPHRDAATGPGRVAVPS